MRTTAPPLTHWTRAGISPCRLVLQRLEFAAGGSGGDCNRRGGQGRTSILPWPTSSRGMTTDGFNSVGWILCEPLSLSCNNPTHERVCPVAVELEAEAPKWAGAAGIARTACAAWPRGDAHVICSPGLRPTPAIPWGSAGHPISAIESPSQSRGPAGVPSSASVVLELLQGSGANVLTYSMNTPRRATEELRAGLAPGLQRCRCALEDAERWTKQPIMLRPNSRPRLRVETHIPDIAERSQGVGHAQPGASSGNLGCQLSNFVDLCFASKRRRPLSCSLLGRMQR